MCALACSLCLLFALSACSVQQPSRNLSDRVLKQRMVAVGNIKKITKAMKSDHFAAQRTNRAH